MICEFSWGGWPGLGPAAASLFFASPKKSKQKKGEPGVRSPALRSGVPCAARNRREAQKLGPLALRHLSLLIRRPLRCSARPQRRGAGTSASRDARAMVSVIRSKPVLPSEGLKAPGSLAVMRRRVAQGQAGKGAQMSEPEGRVSARPAWAEQRSVPVAQRRDDASGSPFFAYFLWRSKESRGAAGRTSRPPPSRKLTNP